MKTAITPNYIFNATARTLDLTAISSFDIKKLFAIINLDRQEIIYAVGSANQGFTSISGAIITLAYNTSTHSNSDRLQIIYDDRIVEIPGDDTDSEAIAVRALPQHVSRVGFAKAIANGVDPEFFATAIIGTGMTVNQTGGNLVITAGTNARSETIIRSLASWKGGLRLRSRSTLSQRIINQNFIIELVDVIGDGLSYVINSATSITVTIPNNPYTAQNIGQSVSIAGFSGTGTFLSGRYAIASVSGNDVTFTVSGFTVGSGTCSLFGMNYYRLLYDGTSATNALFQTQRNGYANAAISATINTTASPGHLAIITGNDLEASLHDQLTASATGVQATLRATQVENIPDDKSLRLQIRVLNLGTAPASNTTYTVGFIAVGNYANQDVLLNGIKPMSPNPLPVDILRSVSVGSNLQAGTNRAAFLAGAGIWYDDTSTSLAANATFTGTSRDLTVTATATAFANAATYAQEFVVSAETDVSGTLWIEASRDNTTWRRVKSVATAAVTGGGQYAEIVHRPSWRYVRVGFTNGATIQARLTVGSFAKAI